MKLEPYYAADRRCYDGCPSSDLQKELDNIGKLKKQLEDFGGRCTYFPDGEFYLGSYNKDGKVKFVTEEIRDQQAALIATIQALKGEK